MGNDVEDDTQRRNSRFFKRRKLSPTHTFGVVSHIWNLEIFLFSLARRASFLCCIWVVLIVCIAYIDFQAGSIHKP